eukprot:645040-Rhodomonas_salina.2
MCGTEIAYGVTLTARHLVEIRGLWEAGEGEEEGGGGGAEGGEGGNVTLSAYALATQCPVLASPYGACRVCGCYAMPGTDQAYDNTLPPLIDVAYGATCAVLMRAVWC